VLERSGAKFAEVPMQFVNRAEGRSKMSPKLAVESLRVVTVMALFGLCSRNGGARFSISSSTPPAKVPLDYFDGVLGTHKVPFAPL